MLVGPWLGALSVSVVLFVQGLVFADGGLSALGLNIINMALVPALVGYVIFRTVRVAVDLPFSRELRWICDAEGCRAGADRRAAS